jgi:serine/threonine-protein kinase RsbW
VPAVSLSPEAVPAKVMRWRRAFPGQPTHVRRAREFVRFLLTDAPAGLDAVQVAAELLANAIGHSASGLPGGLFVIEVFRWRGGAALAVTDQGNRPGTPTPVIDVATPDSTSTHGRGLRIVEELSASWGVRGGPAARTVIATFRW